MRALAEFIMRGRTQASLVVAVAASLPMLFWGAAAAGSLVLLRRGLADALSVLVWALLPVLFWWYYGEPRPLMVLSGTLVLALVLRRSQSWVRVLLTSVCVGVLLASAIDQLFAESLQQSVQELMQRLPEMLGEGYRQLTDAERARLADIVPPVLVGMIGALLQLSCLAALMLARWWQAILFNPGGFQREFHALRLHPAVASGLLLAMLMAPAGGSDLLMLAPLCSVPLLVAGLALVHGMLGLKRIAAFWVVGVYVSLVLFIQLMYPLLVLLAVVDSVIDFRGRSRADGPNDPANGEG